MTIHYHCTAGHTGSYNTATTGKTDPAQPDAKHHATCKAVLLTSLHADALGRMVARVGAA